MRAEKTAVASPDKPALRIFVSLSVAFGIASVLVVVVVQKSREIGILRATGISQAQILRLLLLQGGLPSQSGSGARSARFSIQARRSDQKGHGLGELLLLRKLMRTLREHCTQCLLATVLAEKSPCWTRAASLASTSLRPAGKFRMPMGPLLELGFLLGSLNTAAI